MENININLNASLTQTCKLCNTIITYKINQGICERLHIIEITQTELQE